MLDVSIRAGILDLIKNLARQRHFARIYVSHHLFILGNVAHRLLVMYLGQAMEIGAVPVPDPRVRHAVPKISGDISRPVDPPPRRAADLRPAVRIRTTPVLKLS